MNEIALVIIDQTGHYIGCWQRLSNRCVVVKGPFPLAWKQVWRWRPA